MSDTTINVKTKYKLLPSVQEDVRSLGITDKQSHTKSSSKSVFPRAEIRLKPIKLNLLCMKNREKRMCEICEQFGTLLCSSCRATYYCSMDHMLQDRELHADLCRKLQVLRAPVEFSPSQVTRDRLKKQYKLRLEAMYRYTYLKSRAAKLQGDYKIAISSACACYRTAQVAYGESAQLILAMTVLVQLYLLTRQNSKATSHMAYCLQMEKALDHLQPEFEIALRHAEGLVALIMLDYRLARYCFAEQIYVCSCLYHPDHHRTASGYCKLAEIFFDNNEQQIARSLVMKCVHVWSAFCEERKDHKRTPLAVSVLGSQYSVFASDVETTTSEQDTDTEQTLVNMEDTCDIQEGMNILRECSDLLTTKGKCIVQTADLIQITLVQARLLLTSDSDRVGEAKRLVTGALATCESSNLTTHPLHLELLQLNKDLDRKLIKRRILYS